jgi:hypothetical protein
MITKVCGFLLASIALSGGQVLPVAAEDMGGYEIKGFEDLQFGPFGEGSPVQMAVLWGDPMSGPSAFILKVPPGFETPMHTHSATYKAVVLDGEALHWLDTEDKAAVSLVGKGGYWIQPGGQVHADANPTDKEAVALLIYDGPLDFLPAE